VHKHSDHGVVLEGKVSVVLVHWERRSGPGWLEVCLRVMEKDVWSLHDVFESVQQFRVNNAAGKHRRMILEEQVIKTLVIPDPIRSLKLNNIGLVNY
jgi:hypothetical protein